MLPEKDTVDAIFGIVKALNQNERKKESWWAGFKLVVTSLTFQGTWLPCILTTVAVGLVFINRLLGNFSILSIISVLMWTAAGICLCLYCIRSVVKEVRENVSSAVNHVMKQTERDAQHINDLYKYDIRSLKYVLVQLKAKRVSWERRIALLVGALEKIGFIPALIAVFAIFMRPEISMYPSVWVNYVALGILFLYAASFTHNYQMEKLDRVIMLIEMVIEAKKSEESLTIL